MSVLSKLDKFNLSNYNPQIAITFVSSEDITRLYRGKIICGCIIQIISYRKCPLPVLYNLQTV